MTTKTFRHPTMGSIKRADSGDSVKIAALEKLGYVEWTADDVKNEPQLSVTHQTVTNPAIPPQPPALPHLVTPAPAAPAGNVEAQLEAETGKDFVQTGDNPTTLAETDKPAKGKDK